MSFSKITLSSLLIGAVILSACAPPVDDENTESSEAELACRDLSATYRVAGGCGLDGGWAADGKSVVVSQTAGCSPTIKLSTTVMVAQTWNPLPPRFVGPYNMCELARFDAGSHGGVAHFDPAWHCEDPLPPLPPPIAKNVNISVARSDVRDWSASRIDVASCTLLRTGPAAPTPPPTTTTPPAGGPTAKLVRASFLRTANLGYDDFVVQDTIVGLTPRPTTVAAQNGFTWVTVGVKTGFIATYDLK